MLSHEATLSAQVLRAQLQETMGVEPTFFRSVHSTCGDLLEEKVGERLGPVEVSSDENGITKSQTTYFIMMLRCVKHQVLSSSWEKPGTNIAVF